MKYTKNVFKKDAKLLEEIMKKTQVLGLKTITMGFPDIYGRFMGKKFDVDYFNDGVIKKGSNACNYLLGCDMEMTPLPNTKLSSYNLGYGDFTMLPDLHSVRKVNYVNEDTQFLFFSDLIEIEKENTLVEYAPRQLLRKAEENLAKHGLKIKAECEINFTAFYEKYRKAMKDIAVMQPLTEHSNLSNVFYSQANEELLSKINDKLIYSGIPVKSIYGDSGYGQFKICLGEVDSIEFSDNITLLKLVSYKLY
jgi:glutamine synthetase